MAKMIVVMEDGLIQNIVADTPIDVLVKDYDVEGADGSDLYHDSAGSPFAGRIEHVTVCDEESREIAEMHAMFDVEEARRDAVEACKRVIYDLATVPDLSGAERRRIADAMGKAARR